MQFFPCGQHRFKKQLAVLRPAGAFGLHRFGVPQVEGWHIVAAGKARLIQPKHRNNLERNAAHRLECAKGHPAPQKTAAAPLLLQEGFDVCVHRLPRHQFGIVFLQRGEAVQLRGQLGIILALFRAPKKRLGHVEQPDAPIRPARGGGSQRVQQRKKLFAKVQQLPERLGRRRVRPRRWKHPCKRGALLRLHRQGKQKPVQTAPPGGMPIRRQSQLDAVVRVNPPADPGGINPFFEQRNALLLDSERLPDRTVFEQLNGFRRGTAAPGKGEKREKGPCAGVHLAPASVCDGERNPAGILTHPKDGLNLRGVGAHIGHGDENIARLQRGIVLQPDQQLVLEHFQLPNHAVAAVDAQRIVRNRVRRGYPLPGGLRCDCSKNVGLKPGKDAPVLWRDIEVGLRAGLELEKGRAKEAARLAPGGQKRMPKLGVNILRCRRPRLAGEPVGLLLCEQVRPELGGGSQCEKVHLQHPRRRLQQMEVVLGKGGHPEHAHPWRQTAKGLRIPGECRLKVLLHRQRRTLRGALCQQTPKRRLPTGPLSRLPVPQRLGPMRHIAVEAGGDALSHLKPLEGMWLFLEIAGQALRPGLDDDPGQQRRDAPLQPPALES